MDPSGPRIHGRWRLSAAHRKHRITLRGEMDVSWLKSIVSAVPVSAEKGVGAGVRGGSRASDSRPREARGSRESPTPCSMCLQHRGSTFQRCNRSARYLYRSMCAGDAEVVSSILTWSMFSSLHCFRLISFSGVFPS